MIDAYAIGISLNLTSDVDAVMGRIAQQFRNLDEVVKSTRQGIRDMVGDLGGVDRRLGSVVAQARALRDAMQAAADATARMGRAAAGMQVPGGGAGTGGGGSGSGPAMPTPANVNRVMALQLVPPALLAANGAGGAGGGGGGSGLMAVPAAGNGPGGIPLNYTPPPGGSLAQSGAAVVGGIWGMLSPAAKLYYGAHMARQAFNADMREGEIETGLINQGFSPDQAAGAYEASRDTQQNVLGSSVIGNMNLVSKLMAVVQDPKASVDLLPDFARLGVVLDAQGKGAEGDALMAAIRAGEFRGVLSERDQATGEERIDPTRLRTFIQELQATSIATHGRIGPAQTYQFLKSSGVSGSMIDDRALFADSIALQLAMGSANAGTALQGMSMQFSAGKMSQAALNLLSAMGLVTNPDQVMSAGMGNYMMMPGAMDPATQNLMRDNPSDFIMKFLLPHMQAFLAGRSGVDIDRVELFGNKHMQAEFRAAIKGMQTDEYRNATPERRQQMELALGQTLASHIPGGKEIAETIRNVLLIERDRQAIIGAMGRDPYATMVQRDPQLRVRAFGAAAEGLEISVMRLASPLILTGLNNISRLFNQLANTLDRMVSLNHTDRATAPAGILVPQGGMSIFNLVEGGFDHFWNNHHAEIVPPPPPANPPPITMRGTIMLDGHAIGTFGANGAAGQTTAGPDLRAAPGAASAGVAH